MMFRKSVLLATVSLSLLLCTTTSVGASPVVNRRQLSPEKPFFNHAPVQIDAVAAGDKKLYKPFQGEKVKRDDGGPSGQGNGGPSGQGNGGPSGQGNGGPPGQGNGGPGKAPNRHPQKRDGLPEVPAPHIIVPGYGGNNAPRNPPIHLPHHPPAQNVATGRKLDKRFTVRDLNDGYQHTESWWPKIRDRFGKDGPKHKRDLLYDPEEAHRTDGSVGKRSIEAVEHVERRQNDEGLNGGGSHGEHQESPYHGNDEGLSPIMGAAALHKRQVSIHQRDIDRGDDDFEREDDIYFHGNDGKSWNKRSLNVERRSSDDDGDEGGFPGGSNDISRRSLKSGQQLERRFSGQDPHLVNDAADLPSTLSKRSNADDVQPDVQWGDDDGNVVPHNRKWNAVGPHKREVVDIYADLRPAYWNADAVPAAGKRSTDYMKNDLRSPPGRSHEFPPVPPNTGETVSHRDRPSIRRRDAEGSDPSNPVRGDGSQSSGRYKNEDGEGWETDDGRSQERSDSGRRQSGSSSEKTGGYPDYFGENHEREYNPYLPTEPGIEVTELPPSYVPRHKQDPRLESAQYAMTAPYQPLIAPDPAVTTEKPTHPKPDAGTQKPAPVTKTDFFDSPPNAAHPYIYISSTLKGQAQGASYYGSCRCTRGPGDDMLGTDSTTCLGKYVRIANTTATCTNVFKDVVRCTEAGGNDKMEAGDSVWWQQAFCKRCVDAGGVSDPIFQCPDGYSPEGKVDAAKEAKPDPAAAKPATKADPAPKPQPKK